VNLFEKMICLITYINSTEILSCSHNECSMSCANGGFRTGHCNYDASVREKKCECEVPSWLSTVSGKVWDLGSNIAGAVIGKRISKKLKSKDLWRTLKG